MEKMERYRHYGFTLVELMLVLTVAAVLLALAMPSFRETVIHNRISAASNTFMGAIGYARTEAIRRNVSVTLCKSVNGTVCSTAAATNWEDGWIAFVDADADGTLDAGETLLRTWPALPDNYTLRSNASFTNFIRYNARGEANNTGAFAVCHDSSEVGANAIVITRLRPRLGRDINGNGIPELDSGEIASCENP